MIARIMIVLELVISLVLGPLVNVVLSQEPGLPSFQIWLPIVMRGNNEESKMARVGIVHGSGTFESGDLTGFYWSGNQPEVVDGGHPVRAGVYSMRAYLHRTESENKVRTQVTVQPSDTGTPGYQDEFEFDIFGEYWVGFSVYTQAGLVADPEGLSDVIFEIQATPDFGEDYRSPCICLAIDTDEIGGELVNHWRIWRLWDTRAFSPGSSWEHSNWHQLMLPMDPADIGGWTDWVFHIVFDWHDNGTGLLEVWRNGIKVLDVSGGNCSNDTRGGPYPSFGVYKWSYDDPYEHNSEWRLFYFDEFRIGDHTSSYADVAPGDAGPTTTTSTVSTTSTSTLSTTSTSSTSTLSTTTTTLAPSAFQFVTGSYVGDGNDDRNITGIGFQPELVIVQADDWQYTIWRSTTMDAGDSAYFTQDAINFQNAIQGFHADGFQVGTHATVNSSGVTYYFSAFRGDGSDFKLGSYTGDGNDDRNIVGVGFQPTFMWIKSDGAYRGVWCTVECGNNNSLFFNPIVNAANCIQSLIADGFQVGTDTQVNTNGATHHFVCFRDIANVLDTGTYVGDGNDDRNIAVGFEPGHVFVKGDLTEPAIHRIDTMDAGESFQFGGGPSLDRIQAFGATFFQVGTNVDVNQLNEDYYWVAIKTIELASTTSTSSTSTLSTTSTSTFSTTSTSTFSTTSTTLLPFDAGLIVSCSRGTRVYRPLTVAEAAERRILAADIAGRGF